MSKCNDPFNKQNVKVSYHNEVDYSQLEKESISFSMNEKNKLVRSIAATVAHEIRNPVISIKDLVQLLTMGISNPEYYSKIYSEISKIEEVLKRLSRLGERHSVNFRINDMGIILERSIMGMKKLSLFKRIKINLSLKEGLFVYCDEVQLQKAFENIIKNAMEASACNEEVYVTCKTNETHVHIRIKDQGVGIPNKKTEHLFEPCYCIKETGTGFGLMISNKIIKEHNGTIQLKSELEIGTTVDIYIPLLVS